MFEALIFMGKRCVYTTPYEYVQAFYIKGRQNNLKCFDKLMRVALFSCMQ